MQDHTRNNGNSRETFLKLNSVAYDSPSSNGNSVSKNGKSGVKLKGLSDITRQKRKLNGKLNGKLPHDLTVNGNVKSKLNGNTNGKLNGNLNRAVLAQLNNEQYPFFQDKSFRFSVEVPQNIVVRAVNILGMEADTLVDGLRLPGNYVVMLNRETNTKGLYYYKLYVQVGENDDDTVPLADKPGKRFRLIQEKEIVLV